MKNPRRRRTVVSEAVGDGLAIFDPQQQQSYVLNATSALVFQHCDGQTTPQLLAELLRQKFNVPPGQAEQLLWLALDELEKANLLETRVATTQAPQQLLTRRQALIAFATAGLSLALLPIVSSVAQAGGGRGGSGRGGGGRGGGDHGGGHGGGGRGGGDHGGGHGGGDHGGGHGGGDHGGGTTTTTTEQPTTTTTEQPTTTTTTTTEQPPPTTEQPPPTTTEQPPPTTTEQPPPTTTEQPPTTTAPA